MSYDLVDALEALGWLELLEREEVRWFTPNTLGFSESGKLYTRAEVLHLLEGMVNAESTGKTFSLGGYGAPFKEHVSSSLMLENGVRWDNGSDRTPDIKWIEDFWGGELEDFWARCHAMTSTFKLEKVGKKWCWNKDLMESGSYCDQVPSYHERCGFSITDAYRLLVLSLPGTPANVRNYQFNFLISLGLEPTMSTQEVWNHFKQNSEYQRFGILSENKYSGFLDFLPFLESEATGGTCTYGDSLSERFLNFTDRAKQMTEMSKRWAATQLATRG